MNYIKLLIFSVYITSLAYSSNAIQQTERRRKANEFREECRRLAQYQRLFSRYPIIPLQTDRTGSPCKNDPFYYILNHHQAWAILQNDQQVIMLQNRYGIGLKALCNFYHNAKESENYTLHELSHFKNPMPDSNIAIALEQSHGPEKEQIDRICRSHL